MIMEDSHSVPEVQNLSLTCSLVTVNKLSAVLVMAAAVITSPNLVKEYNLKASPMPYCHNLLKKTLVRNCSTSHKNRGDYIFLHKNFCEHDF